MVQKSIGRVTHYYDHLGVAVIKLAKSASLKLGDQIQIKGNKTDLTQAVGSLQVNHADVDAVRSGDDFGIKVDQPVHEGDVVWSTN